MDKISATIKKAFGFTPANATLKTEKSSSSREVATLRLRVSALEREKVQREGAAEDQKKKMDQLFDEVLQNRKQKKIIDNPTRQLHRIAAKEGLDIYFKFLEPCGFEYDRIMR